jgi:hypothetical protein
MARVGFDAQDLESIRTSAPLMGPQVPWIVDQVYLRMFSFDITKVRMDRRVLWVENVSQAQRRLPRPDGHVTQGFDAGQCTDQV